MMEITELKKILNTKSRLIGVDMGTKKVGISISDENRKIATALKTVKHISKLSRISIEDEKAKKLEKDLNSIFKWIEQLNQLNTDKVEPLTSIAETTLRLRKDQIISKNIREDILKNSPKEKKEKEVIRSKLLKRGSEIKERFKELEADILKEVELIIYRSELAEEFKKKLINLLPEPVGLDH